MSQWIGPRALANLPYGTVISQFLLPGSVITPNFGDPLRGKKGVHVFFSQITRSWISDFSENHPSDVTSEFPHYQVGFLERILGTKPRATSTIKVETPPPEVPEAIPQEIPRETAMQNLPSPSSLVDDSPQTVQSKDRIGVDPTLQMDEELIKQIHLPFDKTNPLGEKAITGGEENEGEGSKFSLRKWLGDLLGRKKKE